MTLWTPPVSEVGAFVQARNHRKLATAFLRGEGVVSVGDLLPSGSTTSMALNFADGGCFLQLPDGSYDVAWADAAATKPISAAPGSGSRVDLVYVGYQSKEFGDLVNNIDFFIKAGTVGSSLPPAPDPMAATYQLGTLLVPAGAVHGSDCTFTSTASTTAPVRDGGFGEGDLVQTPGNYAQMLRNNTQSLPTAVITGSNFDGAAWSQVNWDFTARDVSQAGTSMPDLANNRMLCPVTGYYSGLVTVGFPASTSPSGIRGLRVRTIAGSLVAQTIETADNFGFLPCRLSCAYEIPADAGHNLVAEVIQTQGSTLVLPGSGGYDTTSWSQRRIAAFS